MLCIQAALRGFTGSFEMSVFQTLSAGNIGQPGAPRTVVPPPAAVFAGLDWAGWVAAVGVMAVPQAGSRRSARYRGEVRCVEASPHPLDCSAAAGEAPAGLLKQPPARRPLAWCIARWPGTGAAREAARPALQPVLRSPGHGRAPEVRSPWACRGRRLIQSSSARTTC